MKIFLLVLFTILFVLWGFPAETPIPEPPEIITELIDEEKKLEPLGLWISLLIMGITFKSLASICEFVSLTFTFKEFINDTSTLFWDKFLPPFIYHLFFSLFISIFTYILINKLLYRQKNSPTLVIIFFITQIGLGAYSYFSFRNQSYTTANDLLTYILITLIWSTYLLLSKKIKRIFIY